MVAALTRRFGDLDIAEEAAAEAFATAVERWPADGATPKPGAWLTTTAVRKAFQKAAMLTAVEDCTCARRSADSAQTARIWCCGASEAC